MCARLRRNRLGFPVTQTSWPAANVPSGRPSPCRRRTKSLRARAGMLSTNRVQAEPACRRSRGEQIPPRHAAHRWHKDRARKPAAVHRVGTGPPSRVKPAPVGAPLARRIPRRGGCVRVAALSDHGILHPNKCAAEGRPPACRSRACRHTKLRPALCRRVARALRR